MSRDVDDNSEGAALRSWAAAIHERGAYARRSDRDKPQVELATVRAFATSLYAETGFELTEIRCGQDPPDCLATYRGRTVSIELAELVDQQVLQASVRARRHGGAFPAAECFQWGEDDARQRIDCLLDKKQALYQQREPPVLIDILLIHTDNIWLSAANVAAWMPDGAFSPRPNIQTAYLMLGYDGGEYLPIHKLCGAR